MMWAVGRGTIWGDDEQDIGIVIVTEANNGWSRGWLAELSPSKTDPLHKLEREFLKPYKEKLSRAGNGCRFYSVEEGQYYEAHSVQRSGQGGTEIFLIEAGGPQFLTRDQVIAGFNNCDENQLGAKRAELITDTAAAAKLKGLPQLKGTLKQIAWAERLRAELVARAEARLAEADRALQDCSEEDQVYYKDWRLAWKQVLLFLKQQDRAVFWIEQRDLDLTEFARQHVLRRKSLAQGAS